MSLLFSPTTRTGSRPYLIEHARRALTEDCGVFDRGNGKPHSLVRTCHFRGVRHGPWRWRGCGLVIISASTDLDPISEKRVEVVVERVAKMGSGTHRYNFMSRPI